jgi:hypothetical protein
MVVMPDRRSAIENHVAAADHHNSARHYHHQASQHYQIGKDYAHAAHQSICAHGHALKALEYGILADRYFGQRFQKAPQNNVTSSFKSALAALEPHANPIEEQTIAGHHNAAALCHSELVTYHSNAATALRMGFDVNSAELADSRRIGRQALFHGGEAAKKHSDHMALGQLADGTQAEEHGPADGAGVAEPSIIHRIGDVRTPDSGKINGRY